MEKLTLEQMIAKAYRLGEERKKLEKQEAFLRGEIINFLKQADMEVCTVVDGTDAITAKFETKIMETIDVVKLRELVPDDRFMKTVTATKKSVEENCGGLIVKMVAIPRETSPSLSIKSK